MGFGKFETKKTASVTHNRSEQPSTKMSNEQTRNTNTRSVWQWMWRDRQNETRERELCKNRTDTHTHTEWKKSERVKWRRPLRALLLIQLTYVRQARAAVSRATVFHWWRDTDRPSNRFLRKNCFENFGAPALLFRGISAPLTKIQNSVVRQLTLFKPPKQVRTSEVSFIYKKTYLF